KVGVGIKADCTRLRNFLGVEAKSIFELSHLYKLVKYSTSELSHLVNKRLVGLSQQTEEYLRLPLYKGEVIRSSNWSQALDMGQIICKWHTLVSLFSPARPLRILLHPSPC